jgi:hypothetical protein
MNTISPDAFPIGDGRGNGVPGVVPSGQLRRKSQRVVRLAGSAGCPGRGEKHGAPDRPGWVDTVRDTRSP